jgi:AcrR family transcriptional regulator
MPTASTNDRIAAAGLKIMAARGVRNTSLTDVAYEAGVTRVTVHRYCGDKKGLIRLALRRITAVFEEAALEPMPTSIESIDDRLKSLGEQLTLLPRGHLLGRFEEIQRLWPDVYEEFRLATHEAVDRIFNQVIAVAAGDQSLRPGINIEVLRTIFWASTFGLLEAPRLISSNASLAEVFTTVSEVFRHGIIKEAPEKGDCDAV